MPYQNQMESLSDVMSPALAASTTGFNQGVEQQQALAQAQQQNAAAQVAQGTIMDKIQAAQLANQAEQARIPGIQGQSQALQAQGQVAQGLAQSQIAAGQSHALTQMTADQASRLGNAGQIALQAGAALQNVPAAARPAMLKQMADKYGIDLSQVPQLGQIDPNNYPQVLQQFGQGMITASAQWQMEQAKLQNAKDVANIGAAGHVLGAQVGAASREEVARTNAAARQQQIQNVKGQLTAKVAQGTATQQERDALDYINKTEQLTKSGNPFAATLTGTQVLPQMPSVPGSAAPQGQAPQGNEAPALQSMAQQAFGSYEPNKYMYRINPVTGKVQRAPKQ